MALANYRIKSLTVEGFRGFTTPQSISFDGRNVFIFGENGLGKSSIIEAVQWCLFGGTDIQVRNSVYEKQECRVLLNLTSPNGNLTIRRELKPGRTESDLRIEDTRGREVTLREVFPQLAKLRSSERTQVIFAAQHAAGRRSRADITEFARVLYFYLKLEDVPDLIDEISDLVEEQRSESEKVSKRIEVIADRYRGGRKRIQQLVEDIHANPPWEERASSPSEAETDRRIAEFVEELSSLLGETLPKGSSSDEILQKAEAWLNLHARDAATLQTKLRERSQEAHRIEDVIRQAREAEGLLSDAEQQYRRSQHHAQEMHRNMSRRALVSEIERRERLETKAVAESAIAERVAKFCDVYEIEACPACGSMIDTESLREHTNSLLEGGETLEGTSKKLEELRTKLRALDDATTVEAEAGANVAEARSKLDTALSVAVATTGRSVKATTLEGIEAHLAKLRRDLALTRTKTDESDTTAKQLQRRVNEYRRERQYHLYRRQLAELDAKLEVGMEEAHKRYRDQQDFLYHADDLKQLVETSFKNALDRAIPPLNALLSTVYERLTRQRSFELVRVYHDPARIGHLELRVAQKRKPDRNHPVNVLNGQALKALHLVPYFVFSQFNPEILELDLLLIDDPSESFDTSHVALLIEELHRVSEHAQLIVASHEQEKFSPHVDDYFDRDECVMMVVSDFDPVSGPQIDRH